MPDLVWAPVLARRRPEKASLLHITRQAHEPNAFFILHHLQKNPTGIRDPESGARPSQLRRFATVIQRFGDSAIQGFRDSGIQGFRDSGIQGFKDWGFTDWGFGMSDEG